MQVIQLERKYKVNYIFDNERPIYLQLVEKLRLEIASSKLEKGTKLKSVRDLALEARVNPNTMQKALTELEREKLIYTERTNGKYVTNDESLIKNIRDSILKEKVDSFISDVNNIGIDINSIITYLQDYQSRRK